MSWWQIALVWLSGFVIGWAAASTHVSAWYGREIRKILEARKAAR